MRTLYLLSSCRFGALVLKKLKLPDWKIVLITKRDKPQDRGLRLKPNPAKKEGQKLGLEIKAVRRKEELIRILLQPNYDLALVAGFSFILPEKTLTAKKTGLRALGLHPSLLPKHRGAAPIQFALWKGDKETGVDLFQLTKKMDEGDIVARKKIKILPKDNYLTLERKLAYLGAELVNEKIDSYVRGKIKPQPQKGKPTYTRFITKEDGRVDFVLDSPQEIWNKYRSFFAWPGIYFETQGKKIKITKLEFKDERLLIRKVVPEGKKEMSFAEFLRGYSFPLDLKDKIIYP